MLMTELFKQYSHVNRTDNSLICQFHIRNWSAHNLQVHSIYHANKLWNIIMGLDNGYNKFIQSSINTHLKDQNFWLFQAQCSNINGGTQIMN